MQAFVPHLLHTWPQLAVLHFLYEACGLGPPEQAAHIAQPSAEAHAANADATPKALGALHEFVCILGPLPVQGSPFAGAAAHIAGGRPCARTLSAPGLCRQCKAAMKVCCPCPCMKPAVLCLDMQAGSCPAMVQQESQALHTARKLSDAAAITRTLQGIARLPKVLVQWWLSSRCMQTNRLRLQELRPLLVRSALQE